MFPSGGGVSLDALSEGEAAVTVSAGGLSVGVPVTVLPEERNLWWPTWPPNITSRDGLTVERDGEDGWYRLTGTPAAASVRLGGWYETTAGRYRLRLETDGGEHADGLSLTFSGATGVHDVGDGVWMVDEDVRLIMHLVAEMPVGVPVDVRFRPVMTAESE